MPLLLSSKVRSLAAFSYPHSLNPLADVNEPYLLFQADENELKAFPEAVAPVHVVSDTEAHVEKRSEEEEESIEAVPEEDASEEVSTEEAASEDDSVDVEKRDPQNKSTLPKTFAEAKADYLKRYDDVKRAKMDAWDHYTRHGRTEKPARVWRGPGAPMTPSNPKPVLSKWGSQTIYGESLGNWHKTWCGWGLSEEPGMVVSCSCLYPITH